MLQLLNIQYSPHTCLSRQRLMTTPKSSKGEKIYICAHITISFLRASKSSSWDRPEICWSTLCSLWCMTLTLSNTYTCVRNRWLSPEAESCTVICPGSDVKASLELPASLCALWMWGGDLMFTSVLRRTLLKQELWRVWAFALLVSKQGNQHSCTDAGRRHPNPSWETKDFTPPGPEAVSASCLHRVPCH